MQLDQNLFLQIEQGKHTRSNASKTFYSSKDLHKGTRYRRTL